MTASGWLEKAGESYAQGLSGCTKQQEEVVLMIAYARNYRDVLRVLVRGGAGRWG